MTLDVNFVATDLKNPVSPFRHWVQDIWYQNCEEHLTYGEDAYTIKQYWDRYKYWLKREYRHQKDLNVI